MSIVKRFLLWRWFPTLMIATFFFAVIVSGSHWYLAPLAYPFTFLMVWMSANKTS